MGDLQTYVQAEYPIVKRQLEGLDILLYDIWDGLAKLQLSKGEWPYFVCPELAGAPPPAPTKLSTSTRAMIGYSLATYLGEAAIPRARRRIDKPNQSLEALAAFRKTIDKVKSNIKKESKSEKYASSGSFGENNPFTLLWSYLLCGTDNLNKKCLRLIDRRLNTWFKASETVMLSIPSSGNGETPRETIAHSFITLTWLRLWESRRGHKHKADRAVFLSKVANIFKTRVDEQIAHFHLNNGLFDAGELVFSLEGFLLSGLPHPFVDEKLLLSVIQCLGDSQKKSPYWRPIKPITVSHTGQTLLPLSIEIVNSLTRICDILDASREPFHFFKKCKPLFQVYYDWLRSRVQRGKKGSIDFCGWSSEHTYDNRGIHTWETSQVAVFLQAYRQLLQHDLSDHLLNISGLAISYADVAKYSLKDYPKVDPVGKLACLEEIYNYYIKPRQGTNGASEEEDITRDWSLLLYGPPGTGKTTLCSCFAHDLGWRFIHLSPSDFIAEGESLVEGRAKSIFTVLNEQFESVILLDEIDRLILDRSSQDYKRQGDFFQFMTPSMLVKIDYLRELKRSIFVINTNYEERIDSAIKRSGRIDRKLLILPPDLKSRKNRLKKEFPDAKISAISMLANKTVLMSHSEIKQVIDLLKKNKTLTTINAKWEPPFAAAISLVGYKGRFSKDVSEVGSPVAEFLWLACLRIEAGESTMLKEETELLKTVLKDVVESQQGGLEKLRRHRVPKPEHVLDKLKHLLPKT